MAGKKLGIYLGNNNISIIEVKGRHIVSQVRLPLNYADTLNKSQAKADEIAPGSSQEYALTISEALRTNKIDVKEAFLGLSNKDQFIRSFQMPLLTKSELDLGIQFEARKYIPFKAEDLAIDYQYRVNKKSAKMDILYVAVTRNTLDSSISALSEAGLRVKAVEPASFALLRILAITKQLNLKLSFVLITVQDAEVEFIIVNNGFPYFGRDIKLPQPSAGISEVTKGEEASFGERLAGEIRVSLDYFRRQFSGNPVDKALFLSKDLQMQQELIPYLSENLGMTVERVESEIDTETGRLQDLDAIKAYALALREDIKINLSVDLIKKKYVQVISEKEPVEENQSVFNITMLKRPLILSLVLAALFYFLPQLNIKTVNLKLNQLHSEARNVIPDSLKGLDLDSLKKEKTNYISKISALEELINSKLAIGSSWVTLTNAARGGLWLEGVSISIKDDRMLLRIKGSVYLNDQDAELSAVNNFLKTLSNSSSFIRSLKKLDLTFISRVQEGEYMVTRFEIS